MQLFDNSSLSVILHITDKDFLKYKINDNIKPIIIISDYDDLTLLEYILLNSENKIYVEFSHKRIHHKFQIYEKFIEIYRRFDNLIYNYCDDEYKRCFDLKMRQCSDVQTFNRILNQIILIQRIKNARKMTSIFLY